MTERHADTEEGHSTDHILGPMDQEVNKLNRVMLDKGRRLGSVVRMRCNLFQCLPNLSYVSDEDSSASPNTSLGVLHPIPFSVGRRPGIVRVQ